MYFFGICIRLNSEFTTMWTLSPSARVFPSAARTNFIAKMQQRLAHVDQPRADGDQVIITGRGLEAAMNIGYGDMRVVFMFHVAIGEAKLAQHLHSPYLEPDDVVGVVHHAHLIGFGIAHTKLCFVDLGG